MEFWSPRQHSNSVVSISGPYPLPSDRTGPSSHAVSPIGTVDPGMLSLRSECVPGNDTVPIGFRNESMMPTRSCPENHQWPISDRLSITTQQLCPAGQNHPLSAVYQHQSWQLLLPLLTINLHSSCPHCPEHFLLPDPLLATQNLPGHPQTSRPPPHLYLCYSSTVSGVFELPATPRLNHSLLRPKLQLPGCDWPLRGCPVTLLALPDSPQIWSTISSRTPEITIGPQFHPFANNSIGSGRPAMRTCPIDPDWSHDPGV